MDAPGQGLGEHLRLAVESRRARRPEDARRHLLGGMAELHRDAHAPANVVRPLASCLGRQGADDEARACWVEARDPYAALGLDAGVAECAAGVLRLTPRAN